MITFNKFQLENGLTVIHHEDTTTQLCVLNTLYKVGSKDENPNKTGFAHLFEHLMFGGSINIQEFDMELQKAGGESNAFTSNDLTNYYLTLPANNIETGFWLESDRMLSLDFNQEKLNIQKSVVIEEYKERYLNQPYGDIWLNLLPLAYTIHPYRWPTIGKEISHIENATLDDVKSFFSNNYCPNNAILVVAGNVSLDKTKELASKWYADIPSQNLTQKHHPSEPEQTEPRKEKIYAEVPYDSIIKAYHTCNRMNPEYYSTDLLGDILGAGKSARLYNNLVKKENLFSEIDCYLTGDIECGLLVIEGKLIKGISFDQAELAIEKELDSLLNFISEEELQKVKNKTETNISFNDLGVLNKAMKLAYCELLGEIELVNSEIESYSSVGVSQIIDTSKKILKKNNCSTIYYHSK